MPWNRPVLSRPVDWSSLIARISLDGLIPAVELRMFDSPWGKLLGISRFVRDSDKAGSQPEWISVAYPVPSVASELDACRWICSCIGGNLVHECLESFKLNGRRIFDPHAR